MPSTKVILSAAGLFMQMGSWCRCRCRCRCNHEVFYDLRPRNSWMTTWSDTVSCRWDHDIQTHVHTEHGTWCHKIWSSCSHLHLHTVCRKLWKLVLSWLWSVNSAVGPPYKLVNRPQMAITKGHNKWDRNMVVSINIFEVLFTLHAVFYQKHGV